VKFFIENNNWEEIMDYELAAYVNQVQHYRKRVFSFMTCHSGGILDDFAGANSLVLTSSTAEQPSFPGSLCDTWHAEFNYYETGALHRLTPCRLCGDIDADFNADSRISFAEAFAYVDSSDTRSDPQIGDQADIAPNSYLGFFLTCNPEGSGDFNTIQAALNAAEDGFVIELADGIYSGAGNRDIDFSGKAVAVRSRSGDPDACIIDCGNIGRGFYFHSGEDSTSMVQGITIKNGYSASYGGAIFCNGASPSFTRCIFVDNSALSGGALSCLACNPIFTNCTLSENQAESHGGGIYIGDGAIVAITNSIMWSETPDEVYLGPSGHVNITYSDIEGGWASQGNINDNPLFRDLGNSDYHLMSTECFGSDESSCIDAGNPGIWDNSVDCFNGLGTVLSDLGAFGGGRSAPIPAEVIDIPADYPTIQAGVNASSEGDTVLVQPGIYRENLIINQHNLVLGSLFLTTNDTSYISATVIDGDSSGSVIAISNWLDSATIISGFTLQNGFAETGGGFWCFQADPTINYNRIVRNCAGWGGGIACDSANPYIHHNFISSNSGSLGGGLACNYANADITANIIAGNYADQGGGIFCRPGSYPNIINSVIYNNTVLQRGGGIFCFESMPRLTNSILWGNNASAEHEIGTFRGAPVASYCDIQSGWEGLVIIDVAPLFRDPDNNDFHLQAIVCGDPENSPCIDAGDPSIADLNLDCFNGLGLTRSDIGAYGGGHPGGSFAYLPGDVNMAVDNWPPLVIGGDVTYLVNFFRGISANQSCLLNSFWCSADINGDCLVIGSDVTRLVNFFRGQAELAYCPDYQPLWLAPGDMPSAAPDGWPNCE
jgi:hypothetical protein